MASFNITNIHLKTMFIKGKKMQFISVKGSKCDIVCATWGTNL